MFLKLCRKSSLEAMLDRSLNPTLGLSFSSTLVSEYELLDRDSGHGRREKPAPEVQEEEERPRPSA